jgi:hypothetical protein
MVDTESHRDRLAKLEQAVAARRPEAFEMVCDFLAAAELEPTVRALAVAYLGAFASEASERLLISIVAEAESEVVRGKACRALSAVGSERALEPLGRLAAKGPENLRTLAGFAHVLVSHRLRQPSEFMRHPAQDELVLPKGAASAFQSHPSTDARRRELMADLEKSRFKLGDYAPATVEVLCGRTSWAVAMLGPGAAEGLSGSLKERPSVLGVVARRSEEHKSWSVARVILGGPLKGEEFYVSSYRRDGVLDLAGTGNLANRMIDLSAVRRPGAVPVSARVYWYATSLVIVGIAEQQRLPAHVPAPRKLEEAMMRGPGQD